MTSTSRLIVATALGAPVLLALPLPVSVRLTLSILLLAGLPGLVLARAARIDDVLLAGLVIVTGSLAVTFLVAMTLLYLEMWSGVAVAQLVGLVAAAGELVAWRAAR